MLHNLVKDNRVKSIVRYRNRGKITYVGRYGVRLIDSFEVRGLITAVREELSVRLIAGSCVQYDGTRRDAGRKGCINSSQPRPGGISHIHPFWLNTCLFASDIQCITDHAPKRREEPSGDKEAGYGSGPVSTQLNFRQSSGQKTVPHWGQPIRYATDSRIIPATAQPEAVSPSQSRTGCRCTDFEQEGEVFNICREPLLVNQGPRAAGHYHSVGGSLQRILESAPSLHLARQELSLLAGYSPLYLQ